LLADYRHALLHFRVFELAHAPVEYGLFEAAAGVLVRGRPHDGTTAPIPPEIEWFWRPGLNDG